VQHVASAELPTEHGPFALHAYRDMRTGAEHVALTVPTPDGAIPLVRVHSECLTGDALGSLRCDCGPQLRAALGQVQAQGGAVIYLSGHEGRGIGIAAKVAAYHLQDEGRNTVEANVDLGLPVDTRDYAAAAAILHHLELPVVRLLTNNPDKVRGLKAAGIEVVDRTALSVGRRIENAFYLETKRILLGHNFGPEEPKEQI